MKIAAPRQKSVLTDPDSWRMYFFYGEDVGLMRKYASEVVKRVAGSVDDAFRVAILEDEECDRMEEEDSALSFDVSRRVIWIRSVNDSYAGRIEDLLKRTKGDNKDNPLLVVEYPAASAKSKLRKLAEKSEITAAIGCYALAGGRLQQYIREGLAAKSVIIEQQALVWLAERLAADQALVDGEIEKCALYVRDGEPLKLEDLRAITGDSAAAPLGDAISWAFAGMSARADRCFQKALEEGANSVQYVRIALYYLKRLRNALIAWNAGVRAEEAMAQLKPPVFFAEKDRFLASMRRWDLPSLERMADALLNLELESKRSSTLADVLMKRNFLKIHQK